MIRKILTHIRNQLIPPQPPPSESVIPPHVKASLRQQLARIGPPSAARLREVRSKNASEFTNEDKITLIQAYLAHEDGLRRIAEAVVKSRKPTLTNPEELKRAIDIAELEMAFVTQISLMASSLR